MGFFYFKVSIIILSTRGKGHLSQLLPLQHTSSRHFSTMGDLQRGSVCSQNCLIQCWKDLHFTCCQWFFDHSCPLPQISFLFIPGQHWFHVFFHSATEICCSTPQYRHTYASTKKQPMTRSRKIESLRKWLMDMLYYVESVFLTHIWKFHCPPLTMWGRWWWNDCSFRAVGSSVHAAPIGIPISDALGLCSCAPPDSDGFDSFLERPPVLTPIQSGVSGKLGLAHHRSTRETQQSGAERGGGDRSPCGPVSTFNFFSCLNSVTDLNVWTYI